MNNVIEIRPATKQDIPELFKLMKRYIVDFYNRPEPNSKDLTNLIESLLENPSLGIQFVAEKNVQLVGFSTLYFTFSTLCVKRQAILNDLFVRTESRGKKIGEKLFQQNLAYIRENDFSSMTWETAKDNVVARSLYEKMGGTFSEWLSYEIR